MISFGRLPAPPPQSMGEREEAWARHRELSSGEQQRADQLLAGVADDPGAALDDDVWVTADGDEIPYTELSHGHLASIIKMIQRELLQAHTGMQPSGEGAQDAFESEIGQREDELTQLEAERERRREVAFP